MCGCAMTTDPDSATSAISRNNRLIVVRHPLAQQAQHIPMGMLHCCACGYAEGMYAMEAYESRLNSVEVYSEMRATCFHEAGHAIAAYSLGVGCTSIEITTRFTEHNGETRVAHGGYTGFRKR